MPSYLNRAGIPGDPVGGFRSHFAFFVGMAGEASATPVSPDLVGAVLLPRGVMAPTPPDLTMPGRPASRNFAGYAYLAETQDYLTELVRWVEDVESTGDEPVDVFATDFDVDEDLFGGQGRRSWKRVR